MRIIDELSEPEQGRIRFRPRYDRDDEVDYGELTAIDFSDDPGKTIQEPTEDTDINILMKRMGVKDGSALPYFPSAKALYGDFSEMPTDPTEIADMMHAGHLAFMRLPAEIRQRYRTPEDLFNFMNNNDNYDEAVKLGLLDKKQEPVKTPIERLVDKMDTFVSSSTSSDERPLVQTSKSPKETK